MKENIKVTNFLKYLVLHGISQKSLKYYKSDLVLFLNWAADKKITQDLIQEYINSIRLITSTSTLNRRISTLKSFSTFMGFKKLSSTWQDKILIKFESKPKIKNALHKIFFNRPNWYKRYHSHYLSSYIHVAILVLFTSISGYALYDQVFKTANDSLAFPTALTRPNRFLSFQGRLTSNVGNPITSATNVVFKLYDASTAGTQLWTSGTCSITPDQDGIFSTLLGSSCGTEIASNVFSENASVWVGVTVAADAEATPRIQIATVAYALNSETLQGFPAGTGTSTVPYINSAGTLVLANASPKLQSTSGTFAVEGLAMTISTPNASDGVVTINPDGVGTLDLTFEGTAPGLSANGFVNATNANITSGSLYSGTVASAASGYNFINFLSGVSPTSKFSVDSTGLTTVGADLYVSSGISLYNNAVTDDTVEAAKFCTGDGETNCVTDFSTFATGTNYWTRSAGNISPVTLNDTISATTSASVAMTLTQTGAFDAFLVQDSAGDTTPFVIDQSGNVGIGNPTPSAKLSFANDTATGGLDNFSEYKVLLYSTGTANTSYGMGVRSATMAFNSNHDYHFDTNGSTLIAFDDGSLGVATTTPDAKIESLSTTEQLRLTYTDGTVYSSHTVDSSGNLTIDNTGTNTTITDDLYLGSGLSTFGTAVSDDTVEATKFCTGDGETNCVTDFSAFATGTNYWTRSAGNISPLTLNDTISATTSASVAMTLTQTGAFDAFLVQDSAGDTTPFVIDQSGNVGIGISAPSQQLEITGDFEIPNTTFADQSGIIYKGADRFIHDFNYGNNGTVTTEGRNTFAGILAGNLTTGSTATAVYHGSYNTGIGYSALAGNTTGYNNTALGYNALTGNLSGHTNTAIGSSSLNFNSTGVTNTALGYHSLRQNQTGNSNVGLGSQAGTFITGGVTGNLTSDYSIYIGDSTKALADNGQNEIVIGYNATGLGSNTVTLGADTITITALKGSVGIGDTSPDAPLDVVGDVYITDGLSLYETAVSDGTVEATKFCTGDGETNCVTDFSALTAGSSYWSRTAGNLSPANLNDTISATTSASVAMTLTQTGAFDAFLVQDSAGDTTPFVIDQSGNVGIGTAAPISPFELSFANTSTSALQAAASLRISNTDSTTNNGAGIIFSDGVDRITGISSQYTDHTGGSKDGNLSFWTSENNVLNERFTILSSGNVGISDTSPDAPLDVVGDVYISDGLSLYETAVSDGTVEATKFCTGDGETNCVTDFSSITNYWTRSAGNISPLTLNDTISATTSASVAMTLTQTGAFDAFLVQDSAGDTTPFVVDQDGNVAIGSSAVAQNASLYSVKSVSTNTETRSLNFRLQSGSASTISQPQYGLYGIGQNTSTGTISNMYGNFARILMSSSGGFTNAYGFVSSMSFGGGTGNVGSAYNFSASDSGFGGTTYTNQYGLYLGDLTSATNDYAIVTNAGNIVFNEGGDASTDLRVEGDADANLLFTDASADNVGIGTNAPTEKLDVAGDIRSTVGSLQIGNASNLGYSRFGTGTTNNAGQIDTSDDVLLTNIEVDGNIYLDGGQITNAGGVGTIILSSTPGNVNSYHQLTNGSWKIDNSINDGIASLIVNNQKAGDLFTASASGVTRATLTSGGNLTISGDMNITGGDIITSGATLAQSVSGVSEVILSATSFYPSANDGTALGIASTNMWSDIFLASGSVINLNNGDVTITHAANALAFAGVTADYTFDDTIKPAANDGGALGTTANMWSDLFLASGSVINLNNGDITLTHAANSLSMAGGDFNIGMIDGQTVNFDGDGSPTADALTLGNGDTSVTTGVDGLFVNIAMSNASGDLIRLTPSFAGGATDALTFNAIEISAFSPSNAAGTDTVNGISLGNLTDPGATITSTGFNIGTGYDIDISATTSLEFGIGTASETTLTTTAFSPFASDGNALGTTSLMWSDLFLASGSVINFNNGDLTLTHAAESLTFAGGNIGINTTPASNEPLSILGIDSGRSLRIQQGVVAGGTTPIYFSTNSTGNNTDNMIAYLSDLDGTPTTEFTVTTDGSTYIGGTLNVETLTSSGTAALCWDNAGASLINDCSGTPVADYAEIYPTKNDVEYGEILAVSQESVNIARVQTDKNGNSLNQINQSISVLEKTTTPYQQTVIGIASENWSDFSSTGHNVISDDYHPLPVALSGRVPVKISNSSEAIKIGDTITTSNDSGKGMKANFEGRVVGTALEDWNPNSPKDKILVFVNNTYHNPELAITNTGDLNIEQQATNPDEYQLTNNNKVVSKIGAFADASIAKLKAGIGSFKKVETNLISPVANADLIIDLQPDDSQTASKLVIKGENNEEVASIDANGQIKSEELVVNNDATISGTLYANTIESERLDEIESLLAEVEGNQSLFTNSQTWNTNTATQSAEITDVIANNLFVTGNATVTSLFVAENLTVKSLDSLEGPLSIQSLAINPVEIMAGKIKIDIDGNATFEGNVTVAGNFELQGNFVVASDVNQQATESAQISDGQLTSNSTAGKATLPAGLTEIKINNEKLKTNSLVYITPVSSTQNKVLYVKSKGEGEFTIGFNEAIDTDVEFNWWIIELK